MSFKIQGHRGARGEYPENTLAGFKYTLNLGIDAIEIDICFTRDRIPVVYHDSCLHQNISDFKNKPIVELTLSELKKIDCGSLENPDFPNQKLSKQNIPTLVEVFKLFREYPNDTQLNLELKHYGENLSLSVAEYCKELAGVLVENADLLPRLMLHSFSKDLLIERMNHPVLANIPTGLLIEDSLSEYNFSELKTKLNLTYISPKHFLLKTRDQIKTLQSIGLEVITWTVNNLDEWKRLESIGVNAIITDYPTLLKGFKGNC